MKKIEISDDIYTMIMSKKKSKKDNFESILKRILAVRTFDTKNIKKLLFIGNPGVGKSTIREIFFEYVNPDQLLESPLEPTTGVEFYNYQTLDLSLTVLDTSGQELYSILENEQDLTFKQTDYVIFLADAVAFENNYTKIYDLLRKITITAKIHSPNVIITFFIHKIDLIEKDRFREFKQFAQNEHDMFQVTEEIDIPIFFTSIKGYFLPWISIAFMKLFNFESLILSNYNKFLDNI